MPESLSVLVRTYDHNEGFIKKVSSELLLQVSKNQDFNNQVFQCKLCGGILFSDDNYN
jgi:hypothetical protein